jgi:hypothetical protein
MTAGPREAWLARDEPFQRAALGQEEAPGGDGAEEPEREDEHDRRTLAARPAPRDLDQRGERRPEDEQRRRRGPRSAGEVEGAACPFREREDEQRERRQEREPGRERPAEVHERLERARMIERARRQVQRRPRQRRAERARNPPPGTPGSSLALFFDPGGRRHGSLIDPGRETA